MRRLPLLDAVLLAVIVPLWLATVCLHVMQVASGHLAWLGVYVAPSSDAGGYPHVSGFWPGVDPQKVGLAVGDRLLRLGDRDLAGVGTLGFFAHAQEERTRALARNAEPRVTYLRAAVPADTIVPFAPVPYAWRMLPLTVGLVAAGTLVLLRRPGTAVARRFFLGATAFSLHWTWFFGGSAVVTAAWIVVCAVSSTVMFPLILLEVALFPSEVAPARTPRWPWLFAIFGPIALTGNVGFPFPSAWGLRGIYLINVAVIVALLVLLTRNYRKATPRGRRQLRWKMYGFYAGLAPVLFTNIVLLYVPALWWLHDLSAVAMVLIPVCLLIAITRFNLLDIDRLITSTITYSILSVLLVAVVLAVVPMLAEAASAHFDLDRRVGTSLLSALGAISLLSLQRAFSPLVERIFFGERFALENGVKGLLQIIGSVPDPDALLGLVGARLAELFASASCVVYQGPSSEQPLVATFSTAAVAAQEPPPQLVAHGSLVEVARRATGPLNLEDAAGRRRSLDLEPADTAVVESLASTVLVPIKSEGELQGLISLGAKRSGDVYSAGDLALLSAVSDNVAGRLRQLRRERRTAAAAVLVPKQFEVIERIGQGGMGVVYKVRHVTLGTIAALKALPDHFARDEAFVRRFRREARVMAELRHPNIVRVLEIESEGPLEYFLMEYIDGETLGRQMELEGALPLARVIHISLQVAAALDHAHNHEPPVVHRDVSPSNILVERETGRVVVTDFGIAKVKEAQPALTHTGDFIGKPRYAAPEQLRGDRTLDHRADIYALGMVIYEMFTGRPFFDADDREVMRRVVDESAEHVVDFAGAAPESFRSIVARAIAKDRDHRYQTARDLVDDLLRVRDELTLTDEEMARAASSGENSR